MSKPEPRVAAFQFAFEVSTAEVSDKLQRLEDAILEILCPDEHTHPECDYDEPCPMVAMSSIVYNDIQEYEDSFSDTL